MPTVFFEPPGGGGRRRTIAAVLFDWAGTTVDYGSRAPAAVFVEIFRRRGVEITTAEARGPMGRAKREHIARILQVPRVAAAWQATHAREADDADVEAMYEEFRPRLKETLARHSEVIPGVAAAVEACRRLGLQIGSTTGYSRELMEVVAPLAARGGYRPDVIVCADDVSAGRPAPWMICRAAEQLGVFPLASLLVVDDTRVGIEAGRNAGCATVAVSETGNSLGLAPEEVAALDAEERARRLAEMEREFYAAGADLVVRSVADLPACLST